MESVSNERKEILMRDPIRWFKCKLKPPKNGGWEEPRFNASENPLYRSNREIENQEDFIYSERRMEGDDDAVQPGTSI